MSSMIVNRRQVLRGAGGFTLGLPFLPSLLPRSARGAEPVPPRLKRFVAVTTDQGGVLQPNMYPAEAVLTRTTPLYGSHTIASGSLQAAVDGGVASVSPVLTAPAALLTPQLVSKMNVLRGFDFPFYMGHHTGGHLGNYVVSDQGPKGIKSFPTIDQVMAWSPNFYRSLAGIKGRAIVAGDNGRNGGLSWAYANPATGSGPIQSFPVEMSSKKLFEQYLAGVKPGATPSTMPPAKRPTIVDRVLENYRRVRNGNRRLSVADRIRLDAHVGRLNELERRLADDVARPIARGCSDLKAPTQDSTAFNSLGTLQQSKAFFANVVDTVTMLLACGVTRIVVMGIRAPFSDYPGSWHQAIAHAAQGAEPQRILVAGVQQTFEHAIGRLASQLDAIEDAPGETLLDNTLMQWTQESGHLTHEGQAQPIVTFGSAGGFMKTGQYIDYRHRNPMAKFEPYGPVFNHPTDNLGLLHRQWLATALQAMDLPPSEWEVPGTTGYGDPVADAHNYTRKVRPEVFANASQILPLVQA